MATADAKKNQTDPKASEASGTSQSAQTAGTDTSKDRAVPGSGRNAPEGDSTREASESVAPGVDAGILPASEVPEPSTGSAHAAWDARERREAEEAEAERRDRPVQALTDGPAGQGAQPVAYTGREWAERGRATEEDDLRGV